MPPEPQPVPREAPSPEELPRMPLLAHLEELRRRVVYALVATAIAFFGCWAFIERIVAFLARPIYAALPEGTKLAFLGVTDPFILYVKAAAVAALFIASPVVLYQVWRFVVPGLYRRERLAAAAFVAFGSLLFIGGGAFAYTVVFPFAVDFLLGVGAPFEPVITLERYFRFLLAVLVGLGLLFELPLVVFTLAQVGVVTPRGMMRNFRWAVLLIFLAAALLTPTPDVVNLCLFAVPAVVLYLAGVGAAALVGRRANRD